MNRAVKGLLLAVLLVAACIGSALAESEGNGAFAPEARVFLDGERLDFDVPPQDDGDFFMFPLRGLFEEMEFGVHWSSEHRRVLLKGYGKGIVIYPENPLYSINGRVYRFAHPPFIVQGRVMIESSILGKVVEDAKINWEKHQRVLRIARGEMEKDAHLLPDLEDRVFEAQFVEVRPGKESVQVNEVLEVHIAAPFIKDIHAYEIRFRYDPDELQVAELKSPSYVEGEDTRIERVDEEKGEAVYAQARLGLAPGKLSRGELLVLHIKAAAPVEIKLDDSMLQVELRDSDNREIPLLLEERTIQVEE